MKPQPVLMLSIAVLGLIGQAHALKPPAEPLSLSVYKMEVLSYCGLIDDRVAAGFKLERDHLISSLNLSPEAINKARMEGWKFGLAEWQNRGLGGFRNWCRTEGMEAAAYFRNLLIR